jgi:hypothetical protein
MKNAIVVSIFAMTLVAPMNEIPTNKTQHHNIQLAVMCFKTGEQSAGMNKICYYDCLGSPAAITISAVQLCPLTIQR